MERTTGGAHRMLLLSTLAFTVCIAAWLMNGVLVTYLTNNGVFTWTPVQTGWLLGMPVLIGSVMRLPVGILTDKYGGKQVMITVLLISALPLYALSWADSYGAFLGLSIAFGLSGSIFTAGVAYVVLWYPQKRQGTALGIFAAGNAGAALTTLFAPRLLTWLTDNNTALEGWRTLPKLYAGLLVLVAIILLLLARNKVPTAGKSFSQRIRPLRAVRVWRFGLYYFFVYGSFVALSQWLIPYYVNVYALSIVSAGMMTTMFNLPAGLLRIAGGILSDRFGARIVLYWVFGVCLVGLLFLLPPRVELQTPGRGILASRPGVVESITEREILVVDEADPRNRMTYALTTTEEMDIRFGLHHDDEGFMPMPTTSVKQQPQVRIGDQVAKGELLAKGTTHIYFQANRWIFTALVFLIGAMMGIGGAAVYKHISAYYPEEVGAVGGIVGVLGGLGGFFGPILFGYLLDATGVWTTCWALLFLVAMLALIWMRIAIGKLERSSSSGTSK
ncbi:MAG: NarK/NasA family nitrate transporter [Bacteroidetes bacterium]|nr:NarK/NasA family nitrate transporter [Bacteroidota bacterium]